MWEKGRPDICCCLDSKKYSISHEEYWRVLVIWLLVTSVFIICIILVATWGVNTIAIGIPACNGLSNSCVLGVTPSICFTANLMPSSHSVLFGEGFGFAYILATIGLCIYMANKSSDKIMATGCLLIIGLTAVFFSSALVITLPGMQVMSIAPNSYYINQAPSSMVSLFLAGSEPAASSIPVNIQVLGPNLTFTQNKQLPCSQTSNYLSTNCSAVASITSACHTALSDFVSSDNLIRSPLSISLLILAIFLYAGLANWESCIRSDSMSCITQHGYDSDDDENRVDSSGSRDHDYGLIADSTDKSTTRPAVAIVPASSHTSVPSYIPVVAPPVVATVATSTSDRVVTASFAPSIQAAVHILDPSDDRYRMEDDGL